MKQWIIILIIYAISLTGQTMMATIQEQVETDFGTYVLLPVSIEPNALQV